MISVTVEDQQIDLNDSASFAIGGKSPFVSPGELWGPKVYNISALDSRSNNRVFGFSKLLNNTARVKSYANAQIRFADLLWKVGSLKFRDFSGAYNFSFHSDAGDIEARIKNRTLAGMDLGTAPNDGNTTAIYPFANHVFFTVKNPSFYGNKNPDFDGYTNLYKSANSRLYDNVMDGAGENKYSVVPFPYLLHVLKTIFVDLGYHGITGDWTEDENIRRVTLYNNYELATLTGGVNEYSDTITYNRHVPPISIGSFLIDVAIFFGITYKVNPVTKLVEIVKISDWLNSPAYTSMNNRANAAYKIEPNENDGFRFIMKADTGDKAFEILPTWLEEKIGNGSQEVQTEASTLEMLTETNPFGATWEIPYTLQEGAGPEFELGIETRSGLRFMLFDGIKTDSLGNTYPAGHYMRAGFSLRWAGADGIVARCYSEWMDWKSYTEYMERTVELTLVELLQLDTERKVMIDNLKWVVDEYDASITSKGKADRIKTSLKLYSVKL